MPIVKSDSGAIVVTGKAMGLYRLMTLKHGMKLEAKGLKMTRGRSCMAIVKEEFGFKGNRAKILAQLEVVIEKLGAEAQAEEPARSDLETIDLDHDRGLQNRGPFDSRRY